MVFGRAQAFPPVLDLESLTVAGGGGGTTGFVLPGIDAGDLAGQFVSVAGDVNGDGVHDILIGAWSSDPRGRTLAGEVYVVDGRTADVDGRFPLRTLLPKKDGDGSEDLIIGAEDADPPGRSGAGESYLIFGRPRTP